MTVSADVDNTKNLIEAQIASADTRATQTVSQAQQFLNNLSSAANAVPPFIDFFAPSVNLSVPSITTVQPPRPTAAILAIKGSIADEPGSFSVSIPDRLVSSVPIENFTVPTINFPTAPTITSLIKPGSPTISFPAGVPDVPSFTLPTDLTVSAQTLPNVPSLIVPDFDLTIPSITVDLPTNTFNYVEAAYSSVLKDAITAKLLDGVQNGGTGLGATVETAIWNRQVERLVQQRDDDIEKTLSLFSGRGFTMPNGIVGAQVQELLVNYSHDREQASRDVAIEQARIAKEMTQFFLKTGLELEGLELDWANKVANRALEAQKAVAQFAIDFYNAEASRFNLELARYQAKAIEVDATIRTQQLILDGYKAELGAAEVQSRMDSVSIDNYRAILSKHDTSIKLYEAEVNAVLAAIQIEKGKIDIFKAEIDAYIAEIQAQKNEFDLFQAQIDGEKAKIELHQAEVEAYATRVQAIKIANDVVIEQIRADIAEEELNLRAHLANVDIWKVKSDFATSEFNLEADLYRTDAAMYQTDVRLLQAASELDVQTQVRASSLDQASANMSLQAAIANMNALLSAQGQRVEASKAAAQGYAAMAGMIAGSVQGMLQLGGQGTSIETLETAAS
jgi:hypothetical protein